MDKTFDAAEAEGRIYARWEQDGCFKAGANASRPETFCPRTAGLPSTVMRPSVIQASICRRDPIPCPANHFCSRSGIRR